MGASKPQGGLTSFIVLLIGMFLVGLNLRPALTSVSPELLRIGHDLSLGAVGQGVLTTLPVLCLGFFAPLAPRMARRLGSERAIFIMLVVLALALLIRPFVGVVGLFIGSAAAGGGIGVMGVLLPGIVKREFPQHVGVMTGLYTLALNWGAATAAGITEPLRLMLNDRWQLALAFWCLPALLALVVWFFSLKPMPQEAIVRSGVHGSLLRSVSAWQITLYMGLQSSLAYIVFGWLPALMIDRGMGASAAGWALSASIFVQGITAMIVPIYGARRHDQRVLVSLVMLLTLTGLMGCLFAPIASVWLWAVVLGLGQGGTFGLALALLALKAPNASVADELSSMAQGVGYVLASMGPLMVGVLLDVFNSWNAVGLFIASIAVLGWLAGLGATRDRLVANTV